MLPQKPISKHFQYRYVIKKPAFDYRESEKPNFKINFLYGSANHQPLR